MESYDYVVATQCMTYNQALYIEDALRGFAMQLTTFPVVFIIVDDASTDGESDLIRNWVNDNLEHDENRSIWIELPYGYLAEASYKGKNMSKFVVLLLKENHFQTGRNQLKKSYISRWTEKSKYTALCEGDDYWIDELKLKKQVDFMDCNEDYLMCYGQCFCLIETERRFSKNSEGGNVEAFEGLMKKNTVPTPTTLYRNDWFRKYVDKIQPSEKKWLMGDYPMWLYFSHEGKIKFIKEIFAVYRILENSSSHNKNENVKEKFVYSTYEIIKFFANYFNRLDLFREDDLYTALFSNAFLFGNKQKAVFFFKSIKKPPLKIKIKYHIVKSDFLYNLLKGRFFSTID